jgi:hypothetical protein
VHARDAKAKGLAYLEAKDANSGRNRRIAVVNILGHRRYSFAHVYTVPGKGDDVMIPLVVEKPSAEELELVAKGVMRLPEKKMDWDAFSKLPIR